jgi:chitosanase
MTPTPALIRTISRMLNAFENDSGSAETDYRTTYIYHDGNDHRRQITLGRGFTADGGNLKKVIDRYISKGGKLSDQFLNHQALLPDDRELLNLLHRAADEQVMRDAQDEIFTEVYLQPAFDWANSHGFSYPLSFAVIADSFLHSGTMLKFLMDRFAEKKPADGGRETTWIEEYVKARRDWLASKGKPLSNTLYRPRFFLDQIAANNWNLDPPLTANDTRIA